MAIVAPKYIINLDFNFILGNLKIVIVKLSIINHCFRFKFQN